MDKQHEESRRKFEEWLAEEYGFYGEDIEWQQERNCYAKFGVHLAFNAWLAASNSPEIPDGWVMVPKVPTEEMIVDGFESEPDKYFSDKKEWKEYQNMSGCQQAAHRAKLCWDAMLAAAPKPEK
ncbi:TPA: hypothetical protein SLG40_001599 [Serratia odorifera]|nr:hypothetical protein [Serratia odorifera]